MVDSKNKQFDLNQLSSLAGGAAGIVGAGLGAFYNTPKAASAQPYMSNLYQSAMDYQPSDMDGLMAQINATPITPTLSGEDLYNPSAGEVFGSMFGAGMGMYGASKTMTDNLKGTMGATTLKPYTTKDTFVKATTENMEALNNLQGLPQVTQLPLGYQQRIDTAPYLNRTFAFGGGFDKGSMIGEGINLGMAGIGMSINYAGMQAQKRRAEDQASIYNATKAFVDDRNRHNLNLAVEDTKDNMFNMQALQMMADGGIMIKPSKKGTFTAAATKHGMGVQEFASKVLANPEDYSPLMRRKANFARNAAKWHANGGDLNINGTEFPLNGNFNLIGNGGTHEQNPNMGVNQGIASDGQPNKVEENEVVWNDYVFSQRLTVPEKFRKQYKLKEGITFAEAAQKLTGEAKERPNDPISQNGMEEILGALRDEQEDVRAKKQAREMRSALKKMSPEELMQLGAMMQQSQGQQQEQVPQGQDIDPNALQGMIAACGGKLHANGGHMFARGGDEIQARRLLSQMQGNELRALASNLQGYDASQYNTTDNNPLIDFILSNTTGDNKYDALQRSIASSKALELMEGDKAYDIQNIDMTDWGNLFNVMRGYTESKKKGNTAYKYHDDPLFKYQGKTTTELERDPEYQKFKDFVLEHAEDNEDVRSYLQLLDEGINTEQGTEKLFNEEGKLKSNWKDLFAGAAGNDGKRRGGRSYDQIGGIYHFFQNIKDKQQGTRQIYRLNGQNVVVDDPEKLSPFLRETGRSTETVFDENGNPMTTNYIDLTGKEYSATAPTEVPEEDKVDLLPTYQRYAPVLGSAIGAIQSLTEQPKDYSTNVRPYLPTFEPIGDYLAYNPVDTQRYLEANQRQMAAQRGAMANMSGANRNIAMSQMALANQQEQENMANILNAAEQMNFARKAQVGEFNRVTNQFNAQAFNALQPQIAQRDQLLLNQAQRNANTRMSVDQALDIAKGQNLTNLFDNIGAIGRENLAYNMANTNRALDYGARKTGESYFKKTKACGGMLTKKNRRK